MRETWLTAVAFVFALGWLMWLDARTDRVDERRAVEIATGAQQREIVTLRRDIRLIVEGDLLCRIDSLSFQGHPDPDAAKGMP